MCYKSKPSIKSAHFKIFYLFFSLFIVTDILYAQDPDTTPLYYPYAEWEIEHSDYSGNPFDVIATVTFTHTSSGEEITTEMFYDGDYDWENNSQGSTDFFKFRFAGIKLGEWTYETSSDEPVLNGITGSIEVVEQDDPTLSRGFVGQEGQKWIWDGSGDAFIPNLIMAGEGTEYYAANPEEIDNDITEFIVEHEMNGFHYSVFYSWFGINNGRHTQVNNSTSSSLSPSPESFQILETLIVKLYEAGGMVHIWEWGDAVRNQTPNHLSGSINGSVHQRLQRYIAARLGALPGWTLGAGFDLHEEWTGSELETWESYYDSKLGWDHITGARAHQNDQSVTNIMTGQMDYMGHEDHANINFDENIAYERFVEWMNDYPNKIHFSEDRFRDREHSTPSKPFDANRMRQTLWHTAMAGGVAAIYGRADESEGDSPETGIWNGSDNRSFPLINKEEFGIFGEFWAERFLVELERDNSITDGYALATPSKEKLIFYKENTSTIGLDLTGITIESAIAVDTKSPPYTEIDIAASLTADSQNTWTAPSSSDWVISINGSSDGSNPPGSPPGIDNVIVTETTAEVTYSEVSGADSYEYRIDNGIPVDIGTTNPFNITELDSNTSYDLQMRSVNSDGVSNWSTTTTFTTQEGNQPPESPPAIDEVTTTETTATVGYTSTNNTDSYEYRLDGSKPVDIGTSNPFDITDLSPATSYEIQMRSINSDGSSNWSATTTFTTQPEVQPPDSAPAIDNVSTTTSTAEVSYRGVSDADSYEYRIEGGTPVDIGTTNPFEIEDLDPGTSYALQMRSRNADGSSNWSTDTSFTTLQEPTPPSSPPKIDSISTTQTTATVSFTTVDNSDSYEYRLDKGTLVDIGTTNPFEIKDLNPGTSYALQMRSVNNEGSSNWTEGISFTTTEEIDDIPEVVVLNQNYPNPFGHSTNIQYGIPEESHVLIELFDVLGKKLIVLVDEHKIAGWHELNFVAPSRYSSGLYIYRIQTKNTSQTKKMTLFN